MEIFGAVLSAALLASCGRTGPSVTEGRTLYQANGCASCHGPSGHGDGPLASKLASAPIDLGDISLYTQGTTEEAITQTLSKGVTLVHGTPALHQNHHASAMPKFDHLSETERRSLALYVISLRRDPGTRSAQP